MGLKVTNSDIPQPWQLLRGFASARLIFAAGQLASDFMEGVQKEARTHDKSVPDIRRMRSRKAAAAPSYLPATR